MTVAIEDVPMWVVMNGIGHVVASGSCPCFTICSHMMYAGEQTARPKRICKKCRARLKEPETSLIKKCEIFKGEAK